MGLFWKSKSEKKLDSMMKAAESSPLRPLKAGVSGGYLICPACGANTHISEAAFKAQALDCAICSSCGCYVKA